MKDQYRSQYRLLHIFCILLMLSPGLNAQMPDSLCPKSQYNMYSVQTSSQPQQCRLLKQAFVPTPADCVLTVYLNVYLFNKDDGTGNYSTTTPSNIYNLINLLNNTFANLQPPYHQVPNQNVPFISDSKIRVALKNYHIWNNTFGYENLGRSAPGSTATPINDCNAINIIYANAAVGAIPGSNTVGRPGKYIYMPAGLPFDGWGNPQRPDQMLSYSALLHELGHAMGLDHTFIGDSITAARPVIGTNSCCNLMLADDVVREPSWMYHRGSICASSDPNTNTDSCSNNFMSNNNACKQYLSPYQLAIMHYHLRTFMLDVLTNAGYNNAVNANHSFDRVISANETFDSDRYMKGNIIVEPGVQLTIRCNVAMTQSASIIIKPGGKLLIDGGEITNISGRVWSGIQVGGDRTKSQATAGNAFLYQGFLKMVNGATLRHSENAVKTYMTDANDNIIWASTGGVVQAIDSYFINNSRDVEFMYYNTAPSASIFYNCNFITSGAIGRTPNNAVAAPFAHVSLYGIDNVGFYGCNFEFNAMNFYADPGVGIISCDAVFSTGRYAGQNSNFKNLKKAIQVGNGISLKAVNIRETNFTDNTEDAIYLQNTNHSVIDMNYIQAKVVPNNAIPTSGIYLNTSQNYVVKNNTFKEFPFNRRITGIYAYNSRAGSHEIFRNNFLGMKSGINAIDNNSGQLNGNDGLKMNCNDFSQAYNLYDVMLTSSGSVIDLPTVKTIQGETSSNAPADKLVRNIYAAPCGNQNKWYTASNSTKVVEHGCNADAITQPLPQPACSRPLVNVVPSSFFLNYPGDCPQYPSSGGGNGANTAQRLANINTYLGGLQAVDIGKRDYFEIEATLGNKLNIFLSDTLLQNKDSVISILNNSQKYLADADLQTVFAYMHKGDLEGAQLKANALDPGTRKEWKVFLLDLVELYKDSAGVYSLKTNTAKRSMMEAYATGKKEGKFIAQALLKFAVGASYAEPRPEPEEESKAKVSRQANVGLTENGITQGIAVYPNPAGESLNFAYINTEGHALQVILSDALGRKVQELTAYPGSVTSIPLTSLPNGVYLLNAYDDKASVYQTKVLCIR